MAIRIPPGAIPPFDAAGEPARASKNRPADDNLSADIPDFDRLAGIYRWMEWAAFGPWLWWCRCAFLGELSACRNALVLGDGDGRFTAQLLAANPMVRVDAVDASPAMLRALTRRAGRNGDRVRVHLADARLWQPAGPVYDLVVTHFFLDCLSTAEVESLAVKVRDSSFSRAAWVISDFAVPEGWFGRMVARPVVWGLYLAFGWVTGLRIRKLPDHHSALRQAGFILKRRRSWLGGLLSSELWIHEQG